MYLKNICSSFTFLFNWLALVIEHVSINMALLDYLNNQLVFSAAELKDIKKFEGKMNKFTKRQKDILEKIMNNKPLDSEDKRLITWARRAIEDSKQNKDVL